MTKPNYLVTGAGGGVGGVSRQVVDRLLGAGQQRRSFELFQSDVAPVLRERIPSRPLISQLIPAEETSAVTTTARG